MKYWEIIADNLGGYTVRDMKSCGIRRKNFLIELEQIGFHLGMQLAQARSTSPQRISLARRGAAYFEMSGPAEFVSATVLFALMIAIRIVNITRYRFDSDEPQHLHVIWGWARGLVQYRDLFDNHMPLFHILFAPIFGLIGDRATILYEMRFVLLPMYFVAAWCTYQIGTSLFSKRVGIWAVILVGFYARYHFTSVEFRTDNLWAPVWLLCITALISGPLTVRRALSRRPFTWALFWHLNEIGAVFVLDCGRSAHDPVSRWPREIGAIVELSNPVRRRVSHCDGNCAGNDHDLLRVQRGLARFSILRV